MNLLIDEMYPDALADGLQAVGVNTSTVSALKLAGSPDAELFAAAIAGGYTVLTENVSDFTRIAAERSNAGGHHHGILIALASRFSRRPHGIELLIAAIQAVARERLDDRILYLTAEAAVAAGRAPSLGAWVATAMAERARRERLADVLAEIRAELGPATGAETAWTRSVLGL